ncbi:short-chain dehydrogenase/reductase 3 [Aplysia californica]|uniref:Short-chain dehydrogenase/reductase 3 n=1 Tax=Aplysia californica TaxID=6500 RepID=A0ABM0K5F8_APLCA|nr:short-chain dehydrogenase/reductase 3 [Aplysia californica]
MFGLKRVCFLCHLFVLIVKDVMSWVVPPKKKSIGDDVILITGGGRGIGKKLVLEFATHQPKHIIIWGRTEECLAATVSEVRKMNINCSYMICDVSSREEIYSMAKEVEAKFGNVTLLVNNAGVVFPNSVLESSPQQTEQTIRTNVLAHFWTIRAFLPPMLEQKRGHIVNMSSMLGWAGLNGASDYCSSKFAACGLSEALYDELTRDGDSGVTVTAVYPYHVDNSMFAGVATRFPSLFPSIKEDYVALKIVEAVLTNRNKVLLPKLMYAVAFFYSIAPVAAVTSIMKLLGVNKAMEQYHDHHRKLHGHS